MTVFFDMDGTIADLYGVNGWLDDLIANNPRPYAIAKPLMNMSALAKKLNALQRNGYKVGVISWLSKVPNAEYDRIVTETKIKWLQKHLKSVQFDEIHIVPYGTPKSIFADTDVDILFDDEAPNRKEWGINAYDVNNIMGILGEL